MQITRHGGSHMFHILYILAVYWKQMKIVHALSRKPRLASVITK